MNDLDPDLVRALLASTDMRGYISAQGKRYTPPASGGHTSIPVLQFLVGLPMNNLAMAFFRCLNPDIIRISTGEQTTDGPLGTRLSVVVSPTIRMGRSLGKSTTPPEAGAIITGISLECPVGYGCGYDLNRMLRAQREAYGLPDTLNDVGRTAIAQAAREAIESLRSQGKYIEDDIQAQGHATDVKRKLEAIISLCHSEDAVP